MQFSPELGISLLGMDFPEGKGFLVKRCFSGGRDLCYIRVPLRGRVF